MIVKQVLFKNYDEKDLLLFLRSHGGCQVVSPEAVFGEKHVLHSIEQTLKSFAQKNSITRSPQLEFIVRLTGERQIKNALEKARIRGNAGVFAGWGAVKDYADFKKIFQIKEVPLRKVSEEELKEALERSATFWL